MAKADQDAFLRTKAFLVQVSGGPQEATEDGNWSKCSGGADIIEVAETTINNQQQKTFAPAHTAVSPLVLEGFVTPGRQYMLQWIDATRTGADPRRMITVIPHGIDQKPAKHHIYHECLVEEYKYPELHAHSHEMCTEAITCRPERHEIQ